MWMLFRNEIVLSHTNNIDSFIAVLFHCFRSFHSILSQHQAGDSTPATRVSAVHAIRTHC
jgi:hypothetical protein